MVVTKASGEGQGREWMERFLPPVLEGDLPETLSGISDDSRQVSPGDLFLLRVDGPLQEKFLDEAIAKGAALLVASRRHLPSVLERRQASGIRVPVCVVENIQEAAGVIASAWYGEPSRSMKVVGVTGTNGKTTSSFLVRSMLDRSGLRSGLIGTVWFDLGDGLDEAPQTTPGALFLQRSFREAMNNGLAAISMEVSSHALSQDRVAGTFFSAVHFTNLTRDHLDYHKTFEDYFNAKARLLHWVNPDGSLPPAVINVDDPYGRILAEQIARRGDRRLLTYGHSEHLSIHPLESFISLDGIKGALEVEGRRISVDSNLPGDFNLQNIMGAVGCALALGVSPEAVEGGIRSLPGVPGRFERVNPGGRFAVIVDYAHTDDALKNILSSLRPLTPGRVITVFGCGGDRDRGKRPRMGKVAGELSDIVVVTSDNPRTEDPEFIIDEIEPGLKETGRSYLREVDRRTAIAKALSLAKPGDAVLIAGKGHEPYQIVGHEKSHFDDRETAREILASMGESL